MKSHSATRFLLLAFALATITGCAGIAQPDLAPPVPAQWRNAIANAAPPVDLQHWWQVFNDPQLDRLVDQALARNNDVAAARERLLAARTLRGNLNDQFLPQLHARTFEVIDPNASASYFVVGLDATWELGLFGRAKGAREQAQGELQLADATLQSARVSLIGEVVRDWVQLRAAQQRELLLTGMVDNQRQQLRRLRIRQRLQLEPASSVDQANAALAQAQNALVEPRLAIDANAQRLALLLGRNEPDPAWFTPAPLPQLGAWQLTRAPADLLRSRPEIQQAQARVLSALGDTRIARADRFPRLALGGSLVKSFNILSRKKHVDEDAIASAGPIIDIPLFDWGMRKAKQHAQEHELKAAVLAYRQAVLEGVSDAEQALGALREQGQRERQSDVAERALKRVDAAMAKRIDLRLAGPLDREPSRAALAQARLDQLDARTAHDLAYVALFKALGGAPLPADEGESVSASPPASAPHHGDIR